MVDGGAGSIAQRVADELGDAVRLQRAGAIDHAARRSRRRRRRRARRVARATPSSRSRPRSRSRSTFDPALPDDRLDALPQRRSRARRRRRSSCTTSRSGAADGFSGQTAEPGSAAEVTLDASPALGHARASSRRSRSDRSPKGSTRSIPTSGARRCSTRSTHRLGPRAASPVEFIETAWWNEEWTRGCSIAHFRPGILTRYGPLLREPFGRDPLGRHRDGDDVARRDRRRRPLRRTRRRRDPRPHVAPSKRA